MQPGTTESGQQVIMNARAAQLSAYLKRLHQETQWCQAWAWRGIGCFSLGRWFGRLWLSGRSWHRRTPSRKNQQANCTKWARYHSPGRFTSLGEHTGQSGRLRQAGQLLQTWQASWIRRVRQGWLSRRGIPICRCRVCLYAAHEAS